MNYFFYCIFYFLHTVDGTPMPVTQVCVRGATRTRRRRDLAGPWRPGASGSARERGSRRRSGRRNRMHAESYDTLASHHSPRVRRLSDRRCSAARRGGTAPGRHGHQTPPHRKPYRTRVRRQHLAPRAAEMRAHADDANGAKAAEW